MIVTNYAIKLRSAVYVFVLVLALAGVVSYRNIPREGAPDITIPYIFVTSIYDGTSPMDMEKLVTIPLEKKISEIGGVKEVRSSSAESVSQIAVEFIAGQDIDLAKQMVKDKVDLARPDLPPDLDQPVVQELNFSTDIPVFTVALSGLESSDRLRSLADDIKERLEMLPGVRDADIFGVLEREIRVEVDLNRMVIYDIPLGMLLQRLADENVTLSAGNIEMSGDRVQVRLPAEFELVREIRQLPITSRDGRPVYLSDLATVTDTFKDRESISRLNGAPCVSISVKKRIGENSVNLIDQVKHELDEFMLPPGAELTVVYDESDYIDMIIAELENNVVTGFILVAAVLFIFLGRRNSLFVAAAIPLSLLIAFAFMGLTGRTMNMIVLFALILSIGMLVDNAIVIVENIFRHRMEGKGRRESARLGAAEVAWPVATSTMTTLAAFAPLLFWPDIMGQFMGFMPRTLIIVLCASLFVALVINPAICSALIGGERKKGTVAKQEKSHPFVEAYERFLCQMLRFRWVVVIAVIGLLMAVLGLYGRFGRGIELFPQTPPRNATVEVRFAQGTAIETTDAALRDIEMMLAEYDDIKFYLTVVGQGASGFFGGVSGTHIGNIRIEFVDMALRARDSMEIVEELRDRIGQIPGAEVKVDREREGPPLGAPVEIEISGDDFAVLADMTFQIMRAIEGVDGLVDLQSDLEDALPELQFMINRRKAARLGLDTRSVGNTLRTAIFGLYSTRFRAGEEEYDITVRLPEHQRNNLDLLNRIRVGRAGAGAVPLSSIGHWEYAPGRGAITRKNQSRMITISGETEEGRSVREILDDVTSIVEKMELPQGYEIVFAGDDEEMRKAFEFLTRAFMLALGAIMVILVAQFNSVFLPLIIMVSVLLSTMGVMIGLMLAQMRFVVIMTGLGVISLAGIVVNNAIVLIDCIQQHRAAGLNALDASVAAGKQRLRPVLLTAVTTILGLIPMAIGYSLDIRSFPPRIVAGAETSAWWAPMAVAVIFGLAIATILTLVVIPVLYNIFDNLAEYIKQRWAPKDD